ncbi:MAG: hypothetical protein AAF363_08715 [Bacteroidota bacterium]
MRLLKIAVVLILSLNFRITAQEPNQHEKKWHVDEEGEIYWNKSLPVYIQLSSDPSKPNESVTLESKDFAEYTEPYYFDTEGPNFIRTRWAVDKETGKTIYPKVEVLWKVYSDGEPPVTQIRYGVEDSYKSKESIYSGKQIISFEATDRYAGIDKIFYSLDETSFKEFTEPIKLDQEKQYVVKYYAVDKVGNAEEINERSITYDFSPPVTEHTLEGKSEGNVISPKTKVKLTSKDELSGVERIKWKIDDGREYNYAYPLDLAYLKEGEHTLIYYATDHVKNTEEEKKFVFYMDKSAPLVSSDITGDSFVVNGKKFSSGRSQFKLVAVDNKAGVEEVFYSLNGRDYTKYDGPFNLTGDNGNRYIRYYVVDKVGNSNKNSARTGSTGNLVGSYLDLKGPTISHKFIGAQFLKHDTVYISNKTKIQISGYDTESGLSHIDYKINQKDYTNYKEPFTVDEEGPKQIEVSAYDNVINVNKKDFSFVVDNTGPKITTTLSIEPEGTQTVDGQEYKVYSDKVALFISAVDDRTGYNKIYYSFGNGPEKLYTGPIKGFKRDANIEVNVRATDFLNNEETGKAYFRVE